MAKRDLTNIAAAASADLQPIQHGRGLAGMLSGPARLDNALLIAVDQIDVNPQQARQVFDEAALAELTTSVEQHGILQPIGVQRTGTRYQIMFGERRYRAAVGAKLAKVPAIVYEDLSPVAAAILTALENLQREDLDPEDEARQFARLLELTGLSQRALAEQLGKTHNYVSRRVRLLKERPELFAAIREGRITQREALDQVADERVYHGGIVGAVYHGDTASERTPRAELDPVRGTQIGATFKPPARFAQWAYRLQPAAIAPEDKAELRKYLAEAITAAEAALRALDEEV